jgi:acyl-CoA thioesterase I
MKAGDAGEARSLQWAGGRWRRSVGRHTVVLLALLLAVLAQAGVASGSAAPLPPPSHTVLVLGDSLSAGYGLDASQGWVSLTAQRLAVRKPGWRVINASISGETTAGGAARVVKAVASHRPAVVVIELGANDGLRGLPLRETRRNLAYMIGAAQGVQAKVLLVGMRLPPNYGAEYTRAFEGIYRDLARRFDTAFLPFLLAPIMRSADAFQADNMHPTAAVQPMLRDHVWTALEPMLE